MCGRSEFTLWPQYAWHRVTVDVWWSMTEVQRQRARDACFSVQGGQTSVSTDGDLTVLYKSGAMIGTSRQQ